MKSIVFLVLLHALLLPACGPAGDDDDSAAGDDDDSAAGDDDDSTVGSFACGEELECKVDAQFCEVGHPGVPGEDGESTPFYSCQPMFPECVNTPDCACIAASASFPVDSCTSGPLGGDTVEIYYP